MSSHAVKPGPVKEYPGLDGLQHAAQILDTGLMSVKYDGYPGIERPDLLLVARHVFENRYRLCNGVFKLTYRSSCGQDQFSYTE